MGRAVLSACLLATWLGSATGALAQARFPYTAYINSPQVNVRSGPGEQYYPTSQLAQATPVEVYRHDPGGWYAIRPPQESFSWVDARQVEMVDPNLAEVLVDRAAARVGNVFNDSRDVIQVYLSRGEQVRVLGAKRFGSGAAGQTWYKIEPPAGEFRWVQGRFVERAADPEPGLASRGAAAAAEHWRTAPAAHDVRLTAADAPAGEEFQPPLRPRRKSPVRQTSGDDRTDEASQIDDPDTDAAPPRRRADDDEEASPEGQAPGEDSSSADRDAGDRRADESQSRSGEPGYPASAGDEELSADDASAPSESDRTDADENGREAPRRGPRDRRRRTAERPRSDDRADADERDDDRLTRRDRRDDQDDRYAPDDHAPEDDGEPADGDVEDSPRRSRTALAALDRDRDRRPSGLDEADRPRRAVRLSPLPEQLSTAELRRYLDELDLGLSSVVIDEPGQWNLDPLRRRAEELLSRAHTPTERGEVRLLAKKIERFEKIQRQSGSLVAGEPLGPIEPSPDLAGLAGTTRPGRGPSGERYDGVGRLTRVVSSKSGDPGFALVDAQGVVRFYVTPAPGVNLRYYVGQQVGVSGSLGYWPEMNTQHLVAQRVTVVDRGAQRR